MEGISTRVRFLDETGIGDYLAELGSQLASHETESRGYQVSVSYSKLSAEEREARKTNIHRAVAETIRKMKKEDPK